MKKVTVILLLLKFAILRNLQSNIIIDIGVKGISTSLAKNQTAQSQQNDKNNVTNLSQNLKLKNVQSVSIVTNNSQLKIGSSNISISAGKNNNSIISASSLAANPVFIQPKILTLFSAHNDTVTEIIQSKNSSAQQNKTNNGSLILLQKNDSPKSENTTSKQNQAIIQKNVSLLNESSIKVIEALPENNVNSSDSKQGSVTLLIEGAQIKNLTNLTQAKVNESLQVKIDSSNITSPLNATNSSISENSTSDSSISSNNSTSSNSTKSTRLKRFVKPKILTNQTNATNSSSSLNQTTSNNTVQSQQTNKTTVASQNKSNSAKTPKNDSRIGEAAKFQDTGLSDNLIPPQLIGDPKFKKLKSSGPNHTLTMELLELQFINRTFNGSGNNLNHKSWGEANTTQTRHCGVSYTDGKEKPATDLPSPRQVSDFVGFIRPEPQKNKQNLTLTWTIWGQFLDHDIEFSPSNTSQSQAFHIPIPECDEFFDSDCNGGRVIPFSRSMFNLTQQGVRIPFNELTTWIDASMVYGSSEKHAKGLRSFKQGKLRTDPSGLLLPDGKNLQLKDKNMSNRTMEAGDARSNENLILLSFQTLFLREHNRICDLISRNLKNISDDVAFTIARNFVIGLIQKITYDDFLPILLGPEAYKQFIGDYKGYDETIDPTVEVQFTGAAYRFGHSLIPASFPLVNLFGDKIMILNMDTAFFRPDMLDSPTVDRVFRGASRTISKVRDGQFVDQLRNLLIIAPELRHIRMDLLALNIQRGRDQGLPHYNQLRQCYGIPRFTNFTEISDDQEKNQNLRLVYGDDINKVDSYIAIQVQKQVEGSVLGVTGISIIGRQFRKIRNADRYWYERSYPKKIIQQIKATKLSHIIMRNTAISQIQQDVFHYHFGG